MKLTGKKGLIIGTANDKSIAYGCARQFHAEGADLAITYFNEKAEAHVRPLAEDLNASIIMPCNVDHDEQLDAVFTEIENKWGKLDFFLHAIAFAKKDDLQGRVVDTSREGFREAADISCHSFMRMAKRAEPLMKEGGSMLTLSYYGAEKIIDNYNLMGPMKAALEASVRSLAYELAPKKIRVNAISPGLVQTRAASGIKEFEDLYRKSAEKRPGYRAITIDDVGHMAKFLVSDEAEAIIGNIVYVDMGYHIIG